ncbi:hypothetical protein [Neolewinella antarctica]|uniref:Uncharacterized protein n=1 Tax=Neolewinella antarctica TaxID=442734 RepID=A0ABX0X9E4_9BACT|nr:hypothetical protein [Neolewinella antarctica]NJC25626.1 hypothetical protein [Neolewinella antarctica]
MKFRLLFIILPLLAFSCEQEQVEPLDRLSENSSRVNVVFTDVQTSETIESGARAVSPEISRLEAGVYYKGPDYYLSKDLSLAIDFPDGEIYDVTLTFHKLQEDLGLIDVDSTTGGWRYKDASRNLSYYKDHFHRIEILKRGSEFGGSDVSFESYETSTVLVDGVTKTKLEILLDSKFINSWYLPESETEGFNASGTLTVFLD